MRLYSGEGTWTGSAANGSGVRSMEELSLSYNGGKDCTWAPTPRSRTCPFDRVGPCPRTTPSRPLTVFHAGLVLLIVILACLGRHFAPPTTCARRPADSPSKSAAEVAPTTNGNTAQQPQPAETRIEADTTGSAPAVQPVDAASSSPSTTTSSSCSSSSSSSRSASVSFPTSLQAVCIAEPHPFESLDAFVASSAKRYHLDLSRYTLPMRQGLEAYLRDRPSVKAVFVGTRRTDPHGENLRHFDPTDKGWPQFVRVHPVIDWHYGTLPLAASFGMCKRD